MTLKEYRNRVKNVIKRYLPHCMDQFPAGRKFQEPDYTAGLAIGLPSLLNTPELARLGLRFGGCYVHQSPLVTYREGTTTEIRELGDLLVLSRERVDGAERYNAALLQLKMDDEKNEVESGQLKIYTQWPAFDFGRSVSPVAHYDVYPKTVTQGALYSFVHVHTVGSLGFTVASPDRLVVRDGVDNANGVPLQEFLADFVIGISGRSISSWQDHGNDAWSHLIWDIVGRLKDARFKRKNISRVDNREQGAFFDLIASDEWLAESISDAKDLIIPDTESYGMSGLLMIKKERCV